MAIEKSPIEITVRNKDGEPRVREYALEKLSRVIHSLPNLRSAAVEISREQSSPADERYVVQATLAAKGTLLRAEDRGPTATSAIDRVHDVLTRRIRDWRGRTYYTRRQQAARHQDALEMEEARSLPDDKSGLIVRVKSHQTKPLFIEDAVEQMDLLGHDFYFFLNAESGQHNVVYRRKSGGYGLIQPDIDELDAEQLPRDADEGTG